MATRLAASPASPPRGGVDGPLTTSTAGLLPVSLLVTVSLLVLPGATVALVTAGAGVRLGAEGWLLTALVSLAYMLAGAKLWARHPRSDDLSWGELVLWSWARRRRAEGTLERSAGLLEDDVAELLTPQRRREQVKVLRELNAALEVRDPYTRGHARRVERHAHRIALALRCSDDDIFDVRLAASLHDVGKIKVPDAILRKDGPLGDDEWAVMKRHSEVGAELVRRLGNHSVVAAVRSHHERWDGSGYPEGLSGTQIPLGARIIAVADTFDAITSCRPYRDRSDRAHAVAVLKAEAGKQFDPAVVSAFLSTTPHRAAAFAGAAALVAPAARKLVSQWGVVLNKAGAVSLAGTMTASAFTGVAAVERPLANRLQKKTKASAEAEAPPAERDATSDAGSDGAPAPGGDALGHLKKAREGGNGKSRAGGEGESRAGDDAARANDGPSPRGKALGHLKKAHEGGNGKSQEGENGKSQEGGNGKAAAGKSEAGDKAAEAPAGDALPAPPAPAPEPQKPKPVEEAPAPPEPAPEPEAPAEPAAPAPAPAPGQGKDKGNGEK